jgi:GNAT superfamily N-acetyltransferase
VTITLAETETERQDVLALFLDTFADIAPTAVPMPDMDHAYQPLIAQVRDDDTGTLLGAALTCRPQTAAGVAMLPEHMRPPGISKAIDRVSELDLMAVRPDHQKQGLGEQMIRYLEPLLIARGVRAWFGNTTPDLDLDALRRFYGRMGFRVLANGQALPPLGGQEWTMPFTGEPAFYFWKQLRAAS